MIRRLAQKKKPDGPQEARDLLREEVAEIARIADRIFRKIDTRISALEAAEARIDIKMRQLEEMLRESGDSQVVAGQDFDARAREVRSLKARGLGPEEIAEVLNMPAGEIELILSLKK